MSVTGILPTPRFLLTVVELHTQGRDRFTLLDPSIWGHESGAGKLAPLLTRKLFKKLEKFSVSPIVLAHVTRSARGNNVRGSETTTTGNGYFMLSLKFNASNTAIMTSIVMLFENVLPLLLSQIVRQARFLSVVFLSVIGNKAGVSFFVLLLILVDRLLVGSIVSLIALLLPCTALWFLIAGAIPFNCLIMILYPPLSCLVVPVTGVFVVSLITRAAIAEAVTVMRAHFSALFTFANLARLNIFVIAGIAQTTSAHLSKPLAVDADCESAFSWCHVSPKKMSPQFPAALA